MAVSESGKYMNHFINHKKILITFTILFASIIFSVILFFTTNQQTVNLSNQAQITSELERKAIQAMENNNTKDAIKYLTAAKIEYERKGNKIQASSIDTTLQIINNPGQTTYSNPRVVGTGAGLQ